MLFTNTPTSHTFSRTYAKPCAIVNSHITNAYSCAYAEPDTNSGSKSDTNSYTSACSRAHAGSGSYTYTDTNSSATSTISCTYAYSPNTNTNAIPHANAVSNAYTTSTVSYAHTYADSKPHTHSTYAESSASTFHPAPANHRGNIAGESWGDGLADGSDHRRSTVRHHHLLHVRGYFRQRGGRQQWLDYVELAGKRNHHTRYLYNRGYGKFWRRSYLATKFLYRSVRRYSWQFAGIYYGNGISRKNIMSNELHHWLNCPSRPVLDSLSQVVGLNYTGLFQVGDGAG